MNASTIFCGALAVFLLCCTAPLSKAQQRPVQHFYDEYPIRRASTKKVLDGAYAALTFLGEASNQQGYILPRHSSPIGEIQFKEAITAAVKAYEIASTYHTLLSAYTGATEILKGFERDVCEWLSSALLPETNFNCTADNIRHLSQVMKVHETLQGAANKVKAIAPIADEWQGLTSRHYQCAWINGHASCSISPQSPLVIALDQAYRCSLISGDYDLCANV